MTNQAPAGPPPGWYETPDSAGKLRYWDGTQWTEHTHPATPPAQELPQQDSQAASQMADGAKQFAAGAREYFTSTVAPAARQAGQKLQAATNEQGGTRGVVVKLVVLSPVAAPVLAFLSIIWLFLPVVSAYGVSLNFFSDELANSGDASPGGVLLFFFIVVIAFAVLALVLPKTWTRITAAVLGILVGLFTAIAAFEPMVKAGSYSGMSVGAGAVLLALTSVLLFAAAVLTLLAKKLR